MFIDNDLKKEVWVTKMVKTTLKERANNTCSVLGKKIGAYKHQISTNGYGHVKSVLFTFIDGTTKTYIFKLDSTRKDPDRCKIISLITY